MGYNVMNLFRFGKIISICVFARVCECISNPHVRVSVCSRVLLPAYHDLRQPRPRCVCLRMMGKFKWSDLISNEKVLKTLKTKRSLQFNIQQRKLKYFGHIKRKGNILTTMVEGRLQGKRTQGRPRNTWFANIKEWTGRKGGECTRLAADRNLWGFISRQPSSRRWHPQVIQVMTIRILVYVHHPQMISWHLIDGLTPHTQWVI